MLTTEQEVSKKLGISSLMITFATAMAADPELTKLNLNKERKVRSSFHRYYELEQRAQSTHPTAFCSKELVQPQSKRLTSRPCKIDRAAILRDKRLTDAAKNLSDDELAFLYEDILKPLDILKIPFCGEIAGKGIQ